MKVLVLGGDGYLGWATAMYLSRRGHNVAVLDNFAKRRWELELNVEPLIPIRTLQDRAHAWAEVAGGGAGPLVPAPSAGLGGGPRGRAAASGCSSAPCGTLGWGKEC